MYGVEAETGYRQASGEGILNVAVLVRYENVLEPMAQQWDSWIDYQKGKINRGLKELGQDATIFNSEVNISSTTVACVIDYLDF